MPIAERLNVVSSNKYIEDTFVSIDQDDTVSSSIQHLIDSGFNIKYFANGGDQKNNLIPEASICKKYGISLIDGLGKKIQSSSWLLKKS